MKHTHTNTHTHTLVHLEKDTKCASLHSHGPFLAHADTQTKLSYNTRKRKHNFSHFEIAVWQPAIMLQIPGQRGNHGNLFQNTPAAHGGKKGSFLRPSLSSAGSHLYAANGVELLTQRRIPSLTYLGITRGPEPPFLPYPFLSPHSLPLSFHPPSQGAFLFP